MTAQVLKDCKDVDHTLSRLQALVLDAVDPLICPLEWKQAGQLTTEAAADAAQLALQFLGNAHANNARENV